MDSFDVINYLSAHAITISMAATRIAIIFLVLPVFTSELIPALVRNAIFISIALITIIIQPTIDHHTVATSDWVVLYAKEAVIGISIGVLFGIYLWAFETAGQIIDNQIGTASAQLQDPLTGNQTTLIGLFLGRLANYVFVTAGGLLLLINIILESYFIWPIEKKLPEISGSGMEVLSGEFYYYLELTLLVASPMLVVVLVIDSMMGLINRYAQQFNVFFLSMSIKMLAAILMLFITITALMDLLISELHDHVDKLPGLLKALFGG
jgi:type III secretion protein T